MSTPFRELLKTVAERVPEAVGGALAAGDGELVEAWSTWDEDSWAFLTAHIGIVVNHVRSAMHTFHFGDVQWLSIHYAGLEIIAEQLGDKYFFIVACKPPVDLKAVIDVVQSISISLREEMF